jgi:hypothetical protein
MTCRLMQSSAMTAGITSMPLAGVPAVHCLHRRHPGGGVEVIA